MNSFLLESYEDLEISTQIILREALNRNLKIEIIDRSENFIRIGNTNHSEFIKEASKTRLDNYMTYLIMENKTVSKLALQESGITVPLGKSYTSSDSAIKDYDIYKNIKKVLKPSTTNFGIGISISEKNENIEDFSIKIHETFKFANSILIEEFIPGPEYRFLVLGGKTVAVCNRVPANVLGDGINSISNLVDQKNLDTRRGVGHITPLEKIQKGKIEEDVLISKGYNWDFIPKKDTLIYLRRNSNISTGGDSIDYTELVSPDFFKIAEQSAQSVGAQICGVDIISESIESSPTPTSYAVLEINFNPVLYIHDYPYKGKNRHVGSKLLDLLGF
jgi:D-alanine-D-alanine ligase-like ATP-grasp enzyme